MTMTVETRKVPIAYGGWSLIGVGGKPPHSWGNYFWIAVDGARVRVLNMWLENLQHAERDFLKGDDVQVRLYRDADWVWCLIDDSRIPSAYYYNKLCFTGIPRPTLEVATDAYAHVGDPENELEQFTAPKAYYEKRGWTYNDKTGSVSFRIGGQP